LGFSYSRESINEPFEVLSCVDDLFVVLAVVLIEVDAGVLEQLEGLHRPAVELADQEYYLDYFDYPLLLVLRLFVLGFFALELLVQFAQFLHQQSHYLLAEIVTGRLALDEFVLGMLSVNFVILLIYLPKNLFTLLQKHPKLLDHFLPAPEPLEG
jgi:hypothetical protein